MLIPLLASAVGLTALWFLAPFLWRKAAERRLERQCRAARAIVLSFDDGPGERLTPQLLDLLGRHGAKASFYALGRNAEARPEMIDRMLAEGHEVGHHTYHHANAWRADPLTWSRDFRAGLEAARRLGAAPAAFRAPYGKLTLAGLIEALAAGVRFAWWSVDTRDSWDRRPVEAVLEEIRAKGGGVVLMHDFDRFDRVDESEKTHVAHALELTERILQMAAAENYRLARYGDLGAAPAAASASDAVAAAAKEQADAI